MIHAALTDLARYYPVHRLLSMAGEFIFSHDCTDHSPGRTSLGSGISMIIDSYMTEPEENRRLECHRSNIDLQIVLSGNEQIGYAPCKTCDTATPYDTEKDVEFLRGQFRRITLQEGEFCLLFPHDAHMPGLTPAGVAGMVKKMVLKIPV